MDYLVSFNSQKLNKATLTSSVAKININNSLSQCSKVYRRQKIVWCNFTVVFTPLPLRDETLQLCLQIFTSILAAHWVLPVNVNGWLALSSLLVSSSFTDTQCEWAVSFGSDEADLLAWIKSKRVFLSVRPAVCPAGRHRSRFLQMMVQTWE